MRPKRMAATSGNGPFWRLTAPKVQADVACARGRAGERLVGYDNERGKGDHKHIAGREQRYRFVSVEQLVADFLADVERVRRDELQRKE